MYPINVVEKETNISKYLLRMWERRYSFPRPLRDEKGERVYTDDDVTKLKLVKKLMEGGYRPSKIINQPLSELQGLSSSFKSHAPQKEREFIVLIATADMHESLKESLRNHGVNQVVSVKKIEDLKQLDLLDL